jgi:hypothetical protein
VFPLSGSSLLYSPWRKIKSENIKNLEDRSFLKRVVSSPTPCEGCEFPKARAMRRGMITGLTRYVAYGFRPILMIVRKFLWTWRGIAV